MRSAFTQTGPTPYFSSTLQHTTFAAGSLLVTGLLIALPLLLPPLLRRLRSLGTDRSAKSQDRAGIQLARWPAITASSPLGKNIKA